MAAILQPSPYLAIIAKLAEGLTDAEIASSLGMTDRMVKWRVKRLMLANGLYGNGDGRLLIVMAIQGKLQLPKRGQDAH